MFFRIAVFGTVISLSASVLAEQAVQALHYEVSASAIAGRSDFVDRLDSDSYGIRGEVTVPLAQYVGATLNGGYSRLRIEDNEGSCAMSLRTLGAQLFARTPTVGRVGVAYSHDKDASCRLPRGEVIAGGSVYSIFGEYYFEPVTLALSHSRTDLSKSGLRVNSSFGKVAWYATPNISLHASAGMQDAKDRYQAILEFQPALFGKSTSIFVKYTKQTDCQSAMLGVSYFFDNRVDLKIRDRNFR